MGKEFCLISKKLSYAINDRKTVIMPVNIEKIFGVKYCKEKHKQMVYFNGINQNTVKRVYVRILSLIVSFIFDLCLKGEIIVNLNDERVIKDLLRLIKNSCIGDFIMKNGEYYYFNLDIVKNEYSYNIYCEVSSILIKERFFIYSFPIQKSNKINGLKHNEIIIDELSKIKFDYKEMVELTKQAIQNGQIRT